MRKSKKPQNKIVKYLREVSVVVIGVAITLSASYLITRSSEKRDMRLYMEAIKIELEENTKIINKTINYLKPTVNYSAYLRSHNKKSLNKDSINNYLHACFYVESFIFKKNAFETFKSSGMMRLISNKELLLAIWDMYDKLIILKQYIDEYETRRWNYMEKEIPLIENVEELSKHDYIFMYDFYKIEYSEGILIESEQVLKKIKEVLLKLEETKMNKI